MRAIAITGLLLASAELWADHLEVRPRRARQYDERAREGWCAVRVWVDDEVNIFVSGDRVVFETVRGQTSRDAGTECTQPMPAGASLSDFRFRGIDGRGHVELIQEPSRRNGYRAWVRIHDPKGGGEEHHFRLYWRNDWSAVGGGDRDRDRDRYREPDRGDYRPDRRGRYFDERDRMWKVADGACFYRDRDFRGEADCARLGEDNPNVGDRWNDSFSSMKLFGRARYVEVFEHEGFRGDRARLMRDEPDLRRMRNSRGESLNNRITSYRVH